MFNNSELGNLQKQLCELKLAERRVNNDFKHLTAQNRLVDFAALQKINTNRNMLRKKIEKVEARIMPNIIA